MAPQTRARSRETPQPQSSYESKTTESIKSKASNTKKVPDLKLGQGNVETQVIVPVSTKRASSGLRINSEDNDNDNDEDDCITVMQSSSPIKRVHFNEGQLPTPVSVFKEGNNIPSLNTGITPFVRRATLSPATLCQDGWTHSPTKQSSRHSLPSHLEGTSSPDGSVYTIQFPALHDALNDRLKRRLSRSHLSEEMNDIDRTKRAAAKKRRLDLNAMKEEIARKDQELKDTCLQLEVQRQMAIDVSDEHEEEQRQIRTLEEELRVLRERLSQHREEESFYGSEIDFRDVDGMMDDDGPLPSLSFDTVLPSPIPSVVRDASPSKPPTAAATTTAHASSQTSLIDPTFEGEREKFEETILALTRKAEDAKAALAMLHIELQSHGFAPAVQKNEAETNDLSAMSVQDHADSSLDILFAIREAFRRTRSELEFLLPTTGIHSTTSNADILTVVVEHIRGLVEQSHDHEGILEQHVQMSTLLQGQNSSLLDTVNQKETRITQLENNWRDLDAGDDFRRRRVVELETLAANLNAAVDAAKAIQTDKDAQIITLTAEAEEKDKSIAKLRAALTSLWDEQAKLQELIGKVEKEHAAQLLTWKKDSEQLTGSLRLSIKDEGAKRKALQSQLDAKSGELAKLMEELDAHKTSLKNIQADLHSSQSKATASSKAKAMADRLVREKNEMLNDLDEKMVSAETDLRDLRDEIAGLRDTNAAEKDQREAAEAELDEQMKIVEDLKEQLSQASTEANQLRGKMDEQHFNHQNRITELRNEMASNEEEWREKWETEAASVVEGREAEAQLKAALAKGEKKLAQMLKVKDNQLAKKTHALDELSKRLDNAHENLIAKTGVVAGLALKKDQLEASLREFNQKNNDLEESLTQSRATIAQHERDAATTALAHDAELTARNARITSLSTEMEEARTKIADLESQRASLEARITSQAEDMLSTQSTGLTEIQDLKTAILERDAEIENWKTRARELDALYASYVAEKDSQISVLQHQLDAQTPKMNRLQRENRSLKKELRAVFYKARADFAAVERAIEKARRGAENAEHDFDILTAAAQNKWAGDDEGFSEWEMDDVRAGDEEDLPMCVSPSANRGLKRLRAFGEYDDEEHRDRRESEDESALEVVVVKKKGKSKGKGKAKVRDSGIGMIEEEEESQLDVMEGVRGVSFTTK